jgi:hypothetical protein
MKKLNFLLILTVLITVSKDTTAQTTLDLNGYIRTYQGVLLNDNYDFVINQNTLDLKLSYNKSNASLFANPYFYQNSDNENQFDIRELYMEFTTNNIDLRIGKQQIIWGQADGVFITDIVSPKNLSEFLLRDFDEIRIGVTAIKANIYTANDYDIELVYIPTFTATISPDDNSIWKPNMELPIQPTFDYSNKSVVNNLRNGEYFAKYHKSTSNIELELIAAYTWDDDPSLHVSKEIDQETMQISVINISPQHHRLTVYGGSFSTEINDMIVRGEAAYYKGKQFQTNSPLLNDALIEKDYYNYVIGVDKNIGDYRVSGQFIQKVIIDYTEGIINDEVDDMVTLMINKSILREQARIELFGYFGLNNDDSFIRIRGFYFPFDGVTIESGYNFFNGEKGQFGQYDKNDMAYIKLKYNF